MKRRIIKDRQLGRRIYDELRFAGELGLLIVRCLCKKDLAKETGPLKLLHNI